MAISESTLAHWCHHQSAKASKQAHASIREALDADRGLSQFTYEVFLQGSYRNDTDVAGDSEV